jgi:hypothetical protein
MHRLTVGFSDEQLEWIEERADAEGRSNAEIVRRAVDAMRTDAMHTDADRTTAHHTEIADLRERVAALEDQLASNDKPASSAPRSSPPEPPGSDAEDAAPDVVQYARETQPVSRADLLEWVAPRIEIKPESWWKRHGRDQLKNYGAEFVRNVGWRFPVDE